MKKFQDLVAKEKEKYKSTDKLSFRALSNTVDINNACKARKAKQNYPSFRALANQTRDKTNLNSIPEKVQFTFKKETVQHKRQQSDKQNQDVNRFEHDQFQFVSRNRPKPAENLEGISMIDSVVIDDTSVDYDEKYECNYGLSTTEKHQVEKQLSKVTFDLKKKLFNQSKTIGCFKEAMKQVNTVIELQTQRSYTKILEQRQVSRGRSISSPQKSGPSTPATNSFLSIVSKRSPLMIKFKSNKTSPLTFESPNTPVSITRKEKSTSKSIRQKIFGADMVKVTQFRFQ